MNKCEKCLYYNISTQHDYIIEGNTNATCSYYEDIPSDIYNETESCKYFIDIEELNNKKQD